MMFKNHSFPRQRKSPQIEQSGKQNFPRRSSRSPLISPALAQSIRVSDQPQTVYWRHKSCRSRWMEWIRKFGFMDCGSTHPSENERVGRSMCSNIRRMILTRCSGSTGGSSVLTSLLESFPAPIFSHLICSTNKLEGARINEVLAIEYLQGVKTT